MEARRESRLAQVLAPMSVATDLAMGLPVGHAIRACIAATRLGRRLNLDDRVLKSVYYTSLLRFVGCTAYSHEEAQLAGDDIAARRIGASVDFSRPTEAIGFMVRLTAGSRPPARLRKLAAGMAGGPAFNALLKTANCEVAARTAVRLGLGAQVERPLYQIFERWDGKGVPAGLAGERVEIGSRLANVAHCALLAQSLGGEALGDAVVRQRSGNWLDPELSEIYLRHRDELWLTAAEDPWLEVLSEEPPPVHALATNEPRSVAEAFADLADLKSPFLHGHARAVAAHAIGAGRQLGLPTDQLATLEQAALVHDVGRVAIPTSIWEKPAALNEFEWESVRQHPYHTERIVGRAAVFTDAAKIAALHHERLDGRGYHRQLPAALQPLAARVLGAADVCAALLADRPHRPAASVAAAARELESEVASGRLDADAAGAVLAGLGQVLDRRARHWPAGLSDREIDVLRLLAAGLSKRDIARKLYISNSTAHTHVVHIYEKIGAKTRAGAALFAMEHGVYLP